MVEALLDTNILIDLLNGLPDAIAAVEAFDVAGISIIAYIEVLAGIKDAEESKKIEHWLSTFKLYQIDNEIAHLAINIRKKSKIKLPDALILGTAQKLQHSSHHAQYPRLL